MVKVDDTRVVKVSGTEQSKISIGHAQSFGSQNTCHNLLITKTLVDTRALKEIQLLKDTMTPAFVIPDLKTDEDKLMILIAIKKELPSFLTNGTQYGFDSFKVLENQIRLYKELTKDPMYLQLIKKRPPFLDINIKDTESKQIVEKTINPQLIISWRERMIKTLNENNDTITALAESLVFLKRRTSVGSLIGLIKSLNPELQQQAFQQPGIDAKIDFLINNSDTSSPIRVQLADIKHIINLEERIQRFTELSIILQVEPGKWLTGTESIQNSKWTFRGKFKSFS